MKGSGPRLLLALFTAFSFWSCNGGCGNREPLECDGIYLPLITFTFTDASTGNAYCGPATIAYVVVGESGPSTVECYCQDNAMVMGPGFALCHVNPPEGETSRITVSVEGYGDFTTQVTLPYECHPQERVDVVLQPVAGP